MKIYKISKFNPEDPEHSAWEALEYIDDKSEIPTVLQYYGLEYEYIQFDPIDGVTADPIYAVKDGSAMKIVGDDTYPRITDANEWLINLSDNELLYYMPIIDHNNEFWEYPPEYLYHGTREDRINDILKHGLQPRAETRGISNKFAAYGVFTSADHDTASYSYPVVLEILVSQMKEDGYMPDVGKEEPLEDDTLREMLARKIGYENYINDSYSGDGLSDDTIVFHGIIPPKYIRVVE